MIGTRLGQYRLDTLLGQGGMGSVYQATDEMLGRQVAIKVLRQDVTAEAAAEERFRTEAQILARLDHPHILRLHGFSKQDDVLYMITEFVQGESLQRILERGSPVDTPVALRWLDEVLDALQYAHDLGVVHRDIKPANVLIDMRGRARLLDFGIARIVGQDGLTQTGHAVGTLTYMAPEQLLDEPIDGRTDLYALAVVACQLLAGRRPYRSSTTAGLLREIVDGPVPEIASMLPPAAAPVAPVLLRALARRPADRTPSAAHMRQELATASMQAPLPASTGSSPATPSAIPRGVPPLPAAATPPTPFAAVVPAAWPAGATHGSAQHATQVGTGPVPSTATAAAAPTPLHAAAADGATAARRRPGAIAYAIPLVLLVALAGLAWYLLARPRVVTPHVNAAVAPTSGLTQASAGHMTPPAVSSTPATSSLPPETPVPAGLQPQGPADDPRATRVTSTNTVPAVSGTRRQAAAGSAATTAPSAATPPVEEPVAPEPVAAAPVAEPPPVAARAVPAPIDFRDVIFMDRIDDEDEELDVTLRLDAARVVVLDEDGLAKKSIAYTAIDRATYNTRRPGRFSFRRGASHWLTLEVGTTPVVLRLNGRTYEQVLTTLAGHGVDVQRNP